MTAGLLLLTFAAAAQAPFLSATASKSTVGLNEQFQLSYTLNANGRAFQGPDLSAFSVLSGPNQSTSMQYVNGNFSQSVTLSYILQGKAEGNYKIGPATIEVEGKRIASNVVNLSVLKQAGQSSAQNKSGGQQQQQQGDNAGLSDKNIFIRAIPSKTSVYQGEAVILTFRLYTNVNLVNYTVNRMPAMTGFWSQDIDLPEQLDLQQENVNGINYSAGDIKKVVLFPQQNGLLNIEAMDLECIARVRVKRAQQQDPFGMFGNDPFFNDPFFGMGGVRDVKYSFKSNPIRIDVKALPPNPPASYKGSVGRIAFDASIDKEETRANEPVSIKIKLSGNGNLKLSEAPQLNVPPDIEVYDPKVSESLHASTSGVNGSKTFEYLLIPRHEGSYDLEPVTFTYFDLDKKQYVTKSSKPFHIKVARGNGSVTASTNDNTSKSDVQMIGKDIRYIKVHSDEITSDEKTFFGSPGFFGLTAAPLLLFAGLISYQKRNARLAGDPTLMRSRKATGIAQKRLSVANAALKNGQPNVMFDEITKALWGYVGDKLLINSSSLTKENAAIKLEEKKVSKATVDELMNLLHTTEMARYAGVQSANQPDEVYTRAMNLITKLEGELKA